jgi:hypothetical protein
MLQTIKKATKEALAEIEAGFFGTLSFFFLCLLYTYLIELIL